MTIYFGLAIDDLFYPLPGKTQGGNFYCGQKGLLYVLETHLGRSAHSFNNNFLRIEQYRQALLLHRLENPTVFYNQSFQADQFGTAEELLSMRDELLLSGWNFSQNETLPVRLKIFSEIEGLFSDAKDSSEFLYLLPGFADRFLFILNKLATRTIPVTKIILVEPFDLLPSHFQNLFSLLRDKDVEVKEHLIDSDSDDGDLWDFKKLLTSPGETANKKSLKGDGSLLILKAKRETEAAQYLAKVFEKNPEFRPLCLIPEKSRSLDNALIQEGLPSMGIQSSSLARPSLQILKLVPAFLWKPIDPFKLLEFVTLSLKPLEDELAAIIATQLAQNPGLYSESWHIAINQYFKDLEEQNQQGNDLQAEDIRKQYLFWFERRRYDISGTVPKTEAIEIFNYLSGWASELDETNGGKNSTLHVLSQQASQVRELLEELPEARLTHLELERIVRTIYEPAPVQFREQEKGHLPYIHRPGALIGKSDKLLWWNFVDQEPNHFFSKWYKSEREYLEKEQVFLAYPREDNARMLWHRKRPVLNVRKQLLLVIPEKINGSLVNAHPLYSDLEAAFSNLDAITHSINSNTPLEVFQSLFRLPEKIQIPFSKHGEPKPFIHIRPNSLLGEREEETFSSLESLLYYPYKWVFRYKLGLRKSPILSIVPENTLKGNLAHRFFEKLLRQDISSWGKEDVENWIDSEAEKLFRREGAVFLMYGKEPERIAFIRKVKFAAWSLVHFIQSNGWQVKKTEASLAGDFLGITVNARADLVLGKEKEKAVVDLKWGGAKRRENTIRSEEDLQLVIYARLLTEDSDFVHTSYFIIGKGEMIARNDLAFKNITAVNPEVNPREVNQRIFSKMENTFRWRMQQIQDGMIEIRCTQTIPELENYYDDTMEAEEILGMLEMKSNDAPFDDFRTLINLTD